MSGYQEHESTNLGSGHALAEIRLGLGLKQEELADKLGYARSTIGNAERGRGISTALLERYAEAFPDQADALLAIAPTTKRRVAAMGDDEFEAVFSKRSTKTTKLDGTWFALWETSADHEEVVNSEELVATMRRDGTLLLQNVEISAENVKGGYLWLATCRLFDNQYILGTYVAREPNVRSKGCLYLVIHPSGRFINGQWLGCNYDGDWARGLVVIAREREPLEELLHRHREQLPPLPYGAKKGG